MDARGVLVILQASKIAHLNKRHYFRLDRHRAPLSLAQYRPELMSLGGDDYITAVDGIFRTQQGSLGEAVSLESLPPPVAGG